MGTPNGGKMASNIAILAETINTYSRANLHFALEHSTSNSDGVGLQHSRMMITPAGKVCIGTTTPDSSALVTINGDMKANKIDIANTHSQQTEHNN
jgi:hypothetical protein